MKKLKFREWLKTLDIKPQKPANTFLDKQKRISNLFDTYAADFEEHLIKVLDYSSFKQIAPYIQETLGLNLKTIDAVLDLGCGTGLLGEELHKILKPTEIIGVDLSKQMLEICAAKNIYTKLHNLDLIDFLRQEQRNFDFICASDVLIYLGELLEVFVLAQQRLKAGGAFVFTLEATRFGDFYQQANGRYKYSLSYLRRLGKQVGFNQIYSRSINLRKEYGNPVAGHLVLLQN